MYGATPQLSMRVNRMQPPTVLRCEGLDLLMLIVTYVLYGLCAQALTIYYVTTLHYRLVFFLTTAQTVKRSNFVASLHDLTY